MQANWEAAMGEPFTLNPLSKLWQVLGANSLLRVRMSEFYKIAEIAIVSVIASVEDGKTFSNLNFIKHWLRNRLTTNLDIVVKLFAQKFWDLENFPYQEEISDWLDIHESRFTRA
jgi:hypothetical protein